MPIAWILIAAGTVAILSPAAASVSARLGMIALPNSRSSHSTPKSRGYGVVLCAVSLALWGYLGLLGDLGRTSTPVLILVGVVSGMGFIDDMMGLAVRLRLGVQVVAATALVLVAMNALQYGTLTVSTLLSAALGVLFVVGNTNATNFMDGIDGIALVNAILVGAVGSWILTVYGTERLALASAIVAASAFGALPMNFPSSRAFIGDVGSYFLGFAYGALLVIVGLMELRIAILWFSMFVPFITDTSLTIIRRWRRRESLSSSHRDHAYQRAAIALRSHAIVTWAFAALLSFCGLMVVLAVEFNLNALVPVVLSACASVIAYSLTPRARHDAP